MADGCGNWLTITGLTSKELDNLKAFLRSDTPDHIGEYNAFDFDKVRPIPKLTSQTINEWIDENWGSVYMYWPNGRWQTDNTLHFVTKNVPPYFLIEYVSRLYGNAILELKYASDAGLGGVSIFKCGGEAYYTFHYRDHKTGEIIHEP